MIGSKNSGERAPEPREGQASTPACPICGKPRNQDYRPFCSKRCADVDLGRWLNGSYAIPVEPDADEDGDGGAGAAAPLAEGDEGTP